MRVREATAVLEGLVPLRYAEGWDNVGLLVGDPDAEVAAVLVTVDYTQAVAEEARSKGATLVVAYHPPLFAAAKRAPHDAPWVLAIRHGVALWSMHTAFDVVRGGTNDALADACGIDVQVRRPLRAHAAEDGALKLVTFVPESALDRVSDALFAAGAGRIGGYARCSFRTTGTGTFFGGEGTRPAVGESGKVETVPEVRLETVVPVAHLGPVTAALRASHPYEEPAFDLVRLAAAPDGLGLGRVGPVAGGPVARRELVRRLKASLGLDHVLVAGPLDGDAARVAVAAGAGGELLHEAAASGADVFVTGELRHHDALAAAHRGMAVVTTQHSNSERHAVRGFAALLSGALSGVPVWASEADRDPFVFA